MKSEHVEDQRYRTGDFCTIRAEEKVLFKFLKSIEDRLARPLNILDIGCGSGLITREIQKRGHTIIGLDFSSVAVAKAIKNGINAQIANLDDKIDLPTDSFDVVWAGDILEHVFDPIFVISEVARVLKPGGAFLVTIPNDISVMVRLKTLFGISYQELMYRRSGRYKHHTFFSYRLFKFMLKKNNFKLRKVVRLTNIGHNIQLTSSFTPLVLTNEIIAMASKPR